MPRVITLGHDASWSGWGSCLADQDGPLQVSHLAIGPAQKRAGKTKANLNPQMVFQHRMCKLTAYLDGPLEWMLRDGMLLRGPLDPLVRVAVEVPPVGFKAGQPTAYVAVGRIVGSIEKHCCRPTLSYPWIQPPGEWRKWWGISPTRKGRNGEDLKHEAIAIVENTWGSEWLDNYKLGGQYKRKGHTERHRKAGAKGDVAEAILIAVGSSRNAGQAPPNPREWPSPQGTLYIPPK